MAERNVFYVRLVDWVASCVRSRWPHVCHVIVRTCSDKDNRPARAADKTNGCDFDGFDGGVVGATSNSKLRDTMIFYLGGHTFLLCRCIVIAVLHQNAVELSQSMEWCVASAAISADFHSKLVL